MSVFIFFLYFINKDISIRILGTIALLLLLVVWYIFEYKKNKVNSINPLIHFEEKNIKRFILITYEGEKEKEWYCDGVKSFLIGKGTTSKDVDIELGDTHYSKFISNEHAVLNFTNGFWYIEDLNSTNGVGLKKNGEEFALRLKPMVAYKVDEGDIIYISKAKILVR